MKQKNPRGTGGRVPDVLRSSAARPGCRGRCPGDLQWAGGAAARAGRRSPRWWWRCPLRQELRSREEELTRAALQQKSQEELLRRREQQLAAREIDVLERELNILIFQLSQERPNVKKRKGKFKRSRLKLKDGRRISLPSGTTLSPRSLRLGWSCLPPASLFHQNWGSEILQHRTNEVFISCFRSWS